MNNEHNYVIWSSGQKMEYLCFSIRSVTESLRYRSEYTGSPSIAEVEGKMVGHCFPGEEPVINEGAQKYEWKAESAFKINTIEGLK